MTGSPVSLCGSSLWLLWLSCRTWAFEISLLVPEIEGVDRQIKYKILIFYFKKKISGFFSIIVNMIREIKLWWYWYQTIEWFFMGLTSQWRAYLFNKVCWYNFSTRSFSLPGARLWLGWQFCFSQHGLKSIYWKKWCMNGHILQPWTNFLLAWFSFLDCSIRKLRWNKTD